MHPCLLISFIRDDLQLVTLISLFAFVIVISLVELYGSSDSGDLSIVRTAIHVFHLTPICVACAMLFLKSTYAMLSTNLAQNIIRCRLTP